MVLKLINWLVVPSPIFIMFIDEILGKDIFKSNAHWIMVCWLAIIIIKIVYFTRQK